MDIFHTFTADIVKINRSLQRIKTEGMKEFGLNSRHVSCLYYIYTRRDGITFKELCELCNVDIAAVSRSLTSLKKEGYVITENKDDKQYKYLIKLTDKGKKVGAQIYKKIIRVLKEIRADLDPEEEKIFYKNLSKISDNMERIFQGYKE